MPEPHSRIRPDQVLAAYCRGVFPMADSRSGEINWYRPEMRGVIPLDGFTLPRSDWKLIRQGKFEIRADEQFVETMQACAGPRLREDDSWISDEIIELYTQLYELGFAHSIEAYLNGQLVGGLYGIAIYGAFFGESMFSCAEAGGTNASKICLAYLVNHLRERDYGLLDTQFTTPHLERFGCIEITRQDYEKRLERALLQTEAVWGDFSTEIHIDSA